MIRILVICLIFILNVYSYADTLNDAISESHKFNYEESLKILQNIPQNKDVLKHLAWAYLKAGYFDKGSRIFSSLDQHNYEVLFGLGLSCFLQSDYKNSLSYFVKCLEVNKNCAACKYLCAEIKNSEGLPQEAIKLYRDALKLDRNFVEARLRLADTYFKLKKYDDSFKQWSAVRNIDPRFKKAQSQKQKLLGLITKKPEEIVRPKRILKGTHFSPAPKPEKIPLLRVGIVKGIKKINLWATDGIIVSCNGKVLIETQPKEILTVNVSSDIFKGKNQIFLRTKSNNSGIIIKDLKYAHGFAWAGITDREYRGYFEINFSKSAFSLINVVNMEEYLYSVLPSEMPPWAPREALKAQAVIARTEAFHKKNVSKPHRRSNYDLCDDQHCQVYRGIKAETRSTRKAVDATRGRILVYKGKIAHTLYSSNCSGHTQSSKELKGWGYVPYLSGTVDGNLDFPKDLTEFDNWIKHPPDIFCAPSKYTNYAESRWIRIITQEQLKERINRTRKIGGIKKIIPLKRSVSGHVNHLRIEGTKGKLELEKENIIRSIPMGKFRSTNFIVEGYGKTSENLPEYFIFWGAGWGHAVGLCQSGAAGMAQKKYKYNKILKKYYRKTSIKKLKY